MMDVEGGLYLTRVEIFKILSSRMAKKAFLRVKFN